MFPLLPAHADVSLSLRVGGASMNTSLSFWVCLCLCTPEGGLSEGLCMCGQGRGCIRTSSSRSQCTHCLCKASQLFSWFCFSPPRGLRTLLENKGSLKNAALPVFPNVQSAAVNMNGASSDAQPCRCRRKPPARRLPPPTPITRLQGGRAARGSCIPNFELASDPTWTLRAYQGT